MCWRLSLGNRRAGPSPQLSATLFYLADEVTRYTSQNNDPLLPAGVGEGLPALPPASADRRSAARHFTLPPATSVHYHRPALPPRRWRFCCVPPHKTGRASRRERVGPYGEIAG